MFEVCRHPHVVIPLTFVGKEPSFGGVDHWPQEGYDPKLLFCERPLAGITAVGVYKLFETRIGVLPNGLSR